MELPKIMKRKRIILSSILFSMMTRESTSNDILSNTSHLDNESGNLRKQKNTHTKRPFRTTSPHETYHLSTSIESRQRHEMGIHNRLPQDPKKNPPKSHVIESIHLIDVLHNLFNVDLMHREEDPPRKNKESLTLTDRKLQSRVPPPAGRPDRGSRNPMDSTLGLDDDETSSTETEKATEKNALNNIIFDAVFGSDEAGKDEEDPVIGADENNDDTGVPIPVYFYNQGNCPNAGSFGVPCAPSNLADVCNKYNRASGSLRSCLLACEPSICCIHDAPESDPPLGLANCNQDENCAQYAPCYIVWWKLSDMVGPATEFMLEQNDDFFDIPSDELVNVIENQDFFQQLLFHHFDDIEPVLDLLVQSGSIQDTFAMPEIWDANSAISGKDPST
mmetsp:Transcript_10902/g.16837  ORF Transcript_10902/g.16837 Transcript_10902/m.16837 type:complete len:390 (+) Transcript_10902:118-1287(+)